MKTYSKNLTRFMNSVFFIQRPEGNCIRLCLKHLTSQKGNDVSNYPIGEADKITEEVLGDLQQRIETDASLDAEGIGGVQKYQLLAYFVGYPDKATLRLTFRDGDPEADEQDPFESEPVSEKGMLAQMMRHNEAIMRQAVQNTNNVMSILNNTLSKVSAQNEKLIDDRHQSIAVYEELVSQQHTRKALEREAEFKEKMRQDMFDKVSMLAPIAVNKLMGQKVLPEPYSPQMALFRSFAESLKPEQMKNILPLLEPQQAAVIMELLTTLAKEQEAKNGAQTS